MLLRKAEKLARYVRDQRDSVPFARTEAIRIIIENAVFEGTQVTDKGESHR